MPAWMTRRRLGAATALYAVFLAGWWTGRPVRSDGCLEDQLATGTGDRSAAVEPADPGRYLGNLLDAGFPDLGILDWADGLDGRRDGEYGPGDYGHGLRDPSRASVVPDVPYAPCSYRERPRLVAWINGDRS